MKNTTTRKALLTSVVALVICVTMLMGTTFAWFTDTAKVAVNKIQSGTLTLKLTDKDGKDVENGTLYFVDPEGNPITTEYYWEPGCTYKLQPLTITNTGNLALKFKVVVTGINGDAMLNEVIDWTIECGGTAYAEGTEIKLAANGGTTTFTVAGTMDTEANNDYQGKSIDGIAITVLATQDTVEYDSEDNLYDENALYGNQTVVADDKALEEAINNPEVKEVSLGNATYNLNSVKEGLTLKGNGAENTVIEVDTGLVIDEENVALSNLAVNGENVSGNYNSVLNVEKAGTVFDGLTVTGGSGHTWSSSIMVEKLGAGETFVIKNSTISGAFRGILRESCSANILVENCTITPGTYAINMDGNYAPSTLTVTDSTVNGWVSYSANVVATFDNVTFGHSTNGYAYLRPYGTTNLTDCNFADGFMMGNGNGTDKYTITITNCKYNGTLITADNIIGTLIHTNDSPDYGNLKNNVTIIVDGVTVVYQ